MNVALSEEFGVVFTRIPLQRSPSIHIGDALEFDWTTLLPPERCSYVMGNPPFIGAKYQSTEQREQVRRIAALGKSGGTLDYVCAWFLKAGDYVAGPGRIALVTTNSITKANRCAALAASLRPLRARDRLCPPAPLHGPPRRAARPPCIAFILGLDRREKRARRQATVQLCACERRARRDAARQAVALPVRRRRLKDPHLVVRKKAGRSMGWSGIVIGSKPIDGGISFSAPKSARRFLAKEPAAGTFDATLHRRARVLAGW